MCIHEPTAGASADIQSTFVNGCFNRSSQRACKWMMVSVSCTAQSLFPGCVVLQHWGGSYTESLRSLAAEEATSAPQRLWRLGPFQNFHIQWLIQADVKRLAILVPNTGQALTAKLIRHELQFHQQWSTKKLKCKIKTAVWSLLSPTSFTLFLQVEIPKISTSASGEANLCEGWDFFSVPPKCLFGVSWIQRSLSNLTVSSLWARNL